MKNGLRKNDGFTLTEILVVAAILSFVLLAVATLFVLGMRQNAWGRDETVLVSLAQRKMEELRRIAAARMDTDPWTGLDLTEYEGGQWHCLADPDETKREEWPVVNQDTDHWPSVDFQITSAEARDRINEGFYRWNYCVHDVTFGECLTPSMCGPDAAGPYVTARKVVVEVCRRAATDAQFKDRAEHCAKLEMYR
jgi:prepilin-type N-terminal cleavage/methylation domain-containing protein